MEKIAHRIVQDLSKIKEKRPLLHHITNFVVMNETANITLCMGALPVMAHAREEVQEMVQAAGALILNIGTLVPGLVDSMIAAGKRANDLSIPVILDPVGAGATTLRTEASRRLLNELHIDVIRGNSAEVSILAGYVAHIRGVESISGHDDIENIARELALDKKCVVAITGKEDIVSDGERIAVVKNGDPMLGTVTGTGCMATTVIGAFTAVEGDHFLATIGGLVTFGLAGEHAARISGNGPGTFHVALYDCLASIKPEDIFNETKVEL